MSEPVNFVVESYGSDELHSANEKLASMLLRRQDENEKLRELVRDMNATLRGWFKSVGEMANERRAPNAADLLNMDKEHARLISAMGDLGVVVGDE